MNPKSFFLRSVFYVWLKGKFTFFLVLCLLFTLLNIKPIKAENIKDLNLSCPPKGSTDFKIGVDDEGYTLHITGCYCEERKEGLRVGSHEWYLKNYKTYEEAEPTLIRYGSSSIGPMYLKPGEKKTLTIYCIDQDEVGAYLKTLYGR